MIFPQREREQGDRTVVPVLGGHNVCIFKLFGYFVNFVYFLTNPALQSRQRERRTRVASPCVYTLEGRQASPEASLHFIHSTVLRTSSMCIKSSSHAMTGTVGALSRLSAST